MKILTLKRWFFPGIAVMTSFIAATSVSAHSSPSSAKVSNDIYSINGPMQYPGKAPNWIAGIADDKHRQTCTGEFLSGMYVLTAAHCAANDRNNFDKGFKTVWVYVGGGGAKDSKTPPDKYYTANVTGGYIGDVVVLKLSEDSGVKPSFPLFHISTGAGDEIDEIEEIEEIEAIIKKPRKGMIMGYGNTKRPREVSAEENRDLNYGFLYEFEYRKLKGGTSGITGKYFDAVSSDGDSGGPLLFSAFPGDLLDVNENVRSTGKVVGVAHDGDGLTRNTFTALNKNIIKHISAVTGLSFFNSPSDGLVLNGSNVVKFSGYGPKPESIIIYKGNPHDGSIGMAPVKVCSKYSADNVGVIDKDNEPNSWQCNADLKGNTVSYNDKIKLVAELIRTKDFSAENFCNGDCVDFYLNNGFQDIKILSPIPGSTLYGQDNIPLNIEVEGEAGHIVEFRFDGDRPACVDKNSEPYTTALKLDDNGRFTCHMTVDKKEMVAGQEKTVSIEVRTKENDSDDDKQILSMDKVNINIKYSPTPVIKITSPKEGTLQKPLVYVKGESNFTKGNGFKGKGYVLFRLYDESNDKSSFVLSSKVGVNNDGTWSAGPFNVNHYFKDIKQYVFVSLFSSDDNSILGEDYSWNTIEGTGLNVDSPIKEHIYSSGDEIKLNGPINVSASGDIYCNVFEKSNQRRLFNDKATVTSGRWDCGKVTLPEETTHGLYEYIANIIYGDNKIGNEYYSKDFLTVNFSAEKYSEPSINNPGRSRDELKDNKSGNDWVTVAPEYMVSGTGEPNASIDVSISSVPSIIQSPLCNAAVQQDGHWTCGLQATPEDGVYQLTATQTTSTGKVSNAISIFTVKHDDEELEDGGNGGDGNGGGGDGKTGGGEGGADSGPNPPYLIFPATAADGALLSSAAAVGGTVSAGLTSVTGAAGAAGGAIATVGITVAGKVIDDITPDWKDHGKWALDLAGLIKDPLDSYILKVVNKDIHGKELGSRTMSLAHPVIIDEPQDQQVIPWGQPYTIKGRSVRNKTVTVIADGSGQLKNCSGANEDGDWTCPAPTVTGPVTLSATQGGLTGVTTERHYTVSVQPLTIYSPAPGETVINASSPLTGTGQPGAQVAFSGDVTCGTACYTTVAENGNWTFPTQHAAPGTYTVQVVMTPGVRAESDTQSVTYTVSPLVTTPLSVTSPSGGQTLTRNIYSITGKGKPGHSIDVTGIPVAGECHTFADTRTGEWTCGPYEVTERETAQIMVSDSETSESISRSYTLAPHFTVDSPKENEVISGEYTISGRAPSGSVATVGGLGYVADCQATANNSGNWSCPVGGKLYPAVKGDYTLIVRNTAANSKDNPVISRHFTVGDSPIKILWPEETTPVNENNFWVSGTIQNEDKAHITVKETTPGVNPAVTLCEADSDTDYQTWGCQVNKPAGEYTITVSSVGESGTVYESAPTTFSVAPEKVGTTVMSIDRPGEGEIKTGAKYRVYGKINGLDSQNVHYSVEPGVCSSPDMTISYPDWSCTASSAFEGESSSEPKRMTITARESAHGSHDDSRTRHYFVVTSPAISAHLRDKSHPGNKQAH